MTVALALGCSSSSEGIIGDPSCMVTLLTAISSAPRIVGYEACSFDAGNKVTGIFPFDGSWFGVFDVGASGNFSDDETGMDDTATTIFWLSLSVRDSTCAAGFLNSFIFVGASVAEAYLRLFLTKRNITSATKARAMIAPVMIPAIAPPDSFFGEDEADVFDVNEEEVPVGEMPSVMTEAVGVVTIEMNDVPIVPTMEGFAVVDSGALVVLTATLAADEEPAEPKAMSC